MKRNIGIDFGTTNTVVCFRNQKGQLKKIIDKGGNTGSRSIPTAVYFISRKEFIIGNGALVRETRCPKALVTGFKTCINGEKYNITAENNESFTITPLAVSKIFLSKVREMTEKRFLSIFGEAELDSTDEVVITVPVKFNPDEKGKIKKAAEKADLPNVSLAFEPTAAAIAAGMDKEDDIIAVFDFGGGTFDISVIEKTDGDKYTPIDQDGDRSLGGNDINRKIITDIIFPVLAANGIYMPEDSEDFDEDDYGMSNDEYCYNRRICFNTAEELKCSFSEEYYNESFNYTVYMNILGQQKEIKLNVPAEEFDKCVEPLLQKTVDISRKVIDRASRQNKNVQKIIMAGGSSQILKVQQMLKDEFEPDGIEIVISSNIYDLISIGALELASRHNLIAIEERTATQFGVAERTGLGRLKFCSLIPENAVLPVSGTKIYPVDEQMCKSGEIEIKCYERDIKAYPNAAMQGDDGILFINSYRVPVDSAKSPASIEVAFHIGYDGAISLSAVTKDICGEKISDINVSVNSDSELE